MKLDNAYFGLPVYSRPKLDDKTVLVFEEIPFLNSVQESLDSYLWGHGNNLFLKYDYRHLYIEPDNKYIYRDYIKKSLQMDGNGHIHALTILISCLCRSRKIIYITKM